VFSTTPTFPNYRYNNSWAYVDLYGFGPRRWMYDEENLLNIPIGPSVPGLGEAAVPTLSPEDIDGIAYGIAKLFHTPIDQLRTEAQLYRRFGLSSAESTQAKLPTLAEDFDVTVWQQERRYADLGSYLDKHIGWHPEWKGTYAAFRKFLNTTWSEFLNDWLFAYREASQPAGKDVVTQFATRLKNEVWPAAERAGVPASTRVDLKEVWYGLSDAPIPNPIDKKSNKKNNKVAKTALVGAAGIILVGFALMVGGTLASDRATKRRRR